MTHDIRCEHKPGDRRALCLACWKAVNDAERALAQAQADLLRLHTEALKTSDMYVEAQGEIERLKDGWSGYIRSCPWCGTDTSDWVITRTISHLIDHGDTFRAQLDATSQDSLRARVDRLRIQRLENAVLVSMPLVCPQDGHTLGCRCVCLICVERQKALTEPGGQA